MTKKRLRRGRLAMVFWPSHWWQREIKRLVWKINYGILPLTNGREEKLKTSRHSEMFVANWLRRERISKVFWTSLMTKERKTCGAAKMGRVSYGTLNFINSKEKKLEGFWRSKDVCAHPQSWPPPPPCASWTWCGCRKRSGWQRSSCKAGRESYSWNRLLPGSVR